MTYLVDEAGGGMVLELATVGESVSDGGVVDVEDVAAGSE